MTLIELKAKAYDIFAQIEHLQKLLVEVNGEIRKKQQESQEAVAE